MIQVISESVTGDYCNFQLQAEKTTAEISFSRSHGIIQVICKNASHRAWRGMGKVFHKADWDAALKAYKSAEMKSMIEYARDAVAVASVVV